MTQFSQDCCLSPEKKEKNTERLSVQSAISEPLEFTKQKKRRLGRVVADGRKCAVDADGGKSCCGETQRAAESFTEGFGFDGVTSHLCCPNN